MARRRKYKRSKKTVILNKTKLWIFMIVLWFIFFFSLILAKWSPIFDLLVKYAAIPFWEIWLYAFFSICIITWTLILIKWYLMNVLLRQSLIVLMLVSAVLNFPILDTGTWNYQEYGWYISWPIYWLLKTMFWSQTTAIKAFVIILLVWSIIRVLYTFNFTLPKINFKVERESAPAQPKVTQPKLNLERQSTKDIAEKLNQQKPFWIQNPHAQLVLL